MRQTGQAVTTVGEGTSRGTGRLITGASAWWEGCLPFPPSCAYSTIAGPSCSAAQPFSSYRSKQNSLANERAHFLVHSDWFRSSPKAQVNQSESFPESQCRC